MLLEWEPLAVAAEALLLLVRVEWVEALGHAEHSSKWARRPALPKLWALTEGLVPEWAVSEWAVLKWLASERAVSEWLVAERALLRAKWAVVASVVEASKRSVRLLLLLLHQRLLANAVRV